MSRTSCGRQRPRSRFRVASVLRCSRFVLCACRIVGMLGPLVASSRYGTGSRILASGRCALMALDKGCWPSSGTRFDSAGEQLTFWHILYHQDPPRYLGDIQPSSFHAYVGLHSHPRSSLLSRTITQPSTSTSFLSRLLPLLSFRPIRQFFAPFLLPTLLLAPLSCTQWIQGPGTMRICPEVG